MPAAHCGPRVAVGRAGHSRADRRQPRARATCCRGRSTTSSRTCRPFRRRGRRTSAVIGCGELAPLSGEVAEVRSLVVDEARRGQRAGVALVTALADRARELGYVDALRVHAPAVALRPPRVLDRAARLGAREDRARLRRLQPVPPLRPVRRVAAAPRRRRAAARSSAPPQRRSRSRARASSACGSSPSRHDRPGGAAGSQFTAIDGSVSAPAGFRAAGVACGIKKTGGLDLALIVSDDAGVERRRCSRPTRRRRRRCSSRRRTSQRIGRPRARGRDQQRLRQRVHRRPTACDTREAMADAAARAAGCRSVARCSSPRPASSASTLDRQRVIDGIAAAATALARDGGAAAARAIMTTDPFPKEAAVEVTTAARHLPRRRHRQGLRHDRAADGDHARLS